MFSSKAKNNTFKMHPAALAVTIAISGFALTGCAATGGAPSAAPQAAVTQVTDAAAGVAERAVNPCNPCAAKAANPCNPCNPCAAKAANPCNPCNPCAAKAANPCNPCNPCAAKAANPCNPCNPCAAKAANPCNPCNPCAAKAANPCNPCNPCAAKAANPCNPCNPCAAKAANPCNPCNPCAAKVASGSVVATGEFYGINDHVTVGAVSIVKTASGYEILMGEDFVFDGAPDPRVALGKDGEYDPSTLIRLLKSNTGAQSYIVPASIDVSQFNEVHIWCEKFSVGLAIAPL